MISILINNDYFELKNLQCMLTCIGGFLRFYCGYGELLKSELLLDILDLPEMAFFMIACKINPLGKVHLSK